MRTMGLITRLLLAGTALSWLSTGCDNGTDGSTTPQENCRIQRITSTVKTASSDGTIEANYDYDAAGNLLKRTETRLFTYQSGGGENTTSTDTYTYTTDNFLMNYTASVVQKSSNFTGKVTDYRYTSTKTYTYTSGRLAGYTQSDVVFDSNITTSPQPRTTVTTGTYDYDASGQLVKLTLSDRQRWTYRDGQVVDYVGSYPYVIQNGLITKSSFPGTNSLGAPTTLVQIADYDEQRRLIKQQEFLNDSLTTYYTQDWQTGKPATAAIPAFKGHPVVKSPYGEPGILTVYRAYNKTYAGTLTQYAERKATNQLNAQGFVTTTRSESLLFFSGIKQPDVITTVYTYTGCK